MSPTITSHIDPIKLIILRKPFHLELCRKDVEAVIGCLRAHQGLLPAKTNLENLAAEIKHMQARQAKTSIGGAIKLAAEGHQ
jgi:hypothetical protein